ncbi:hypothetical protein WN943_026256 [Citrus x changshan-huyou]
MLFIGWSDDQEALSYAWKMAGTHGVILSVIRFLASKEAEQSIMPEVEKDEEGILTEATEMKRAREYDDEFMNEFGFKTMCAESIIYYEKLVNGSNEVVECIATKYNIFDLYIVGRGERAKSPITMALSEWSSDSPQLGLIGETLVLSQFTAQGFSLGGDRDIFELRANLVHVLGGTRDGFIRIITEACGSYSMISGFMLGIIFIDGELAVIIIERVEEFVNGIMLLSFLLRTNFRNIHGKTNGWILALLTVFAASAKIVSTVFVSAYYAMSTRDSLALGGLMIMTFLAGPIFFLMSKTRKRCNIYKEALTDTKRMKTSLDVALNVIRFRPSKLDAMLKQDGGQGNNKKDGILKIIAETKKERELEDDLINEFRFRSMFDHSVTYHEKLLTMEVKLLSQLIEFTTTKMGSDRNCRD